ncbi:Hypothetical predicted protein [Xyrichtys novacula]|uniref:Uncharacterized protein n=1 Tax=Xyrichtys novacula TaxID=13765 RepID=A0AAV1F0G7_XYRNO|nr:Hypothetical predicted protein [Xyrichtys novacula]
MSGAQDGYSQVPHSRGSTCSRSFNVQKVFIEGRLLKSIFDRCWKRKDGGRIQLSVAGGTVQIRFNPSFIAFLFTSICALIQSLSIDGLHDLAAGDCGRCLRLHAVLFMLSCACRLILFFSTHTEPHTHASSSFAQMLAHRWR